MISIVRDHSGEHVGIEREQVNTFREEIARRTDTSRARSSYPQHPAVAAAAAVAAAVEGDKAEHARNSAPFTRYSPLLSPSDGLQPPIRPFASSSPRRFHLPRSSSPRSTSVSLPLPTLFMPNSRHRPRNLTLPFTCLLVCKSLRPKSRKLLTRILLFSLLRHSNFFKCAICFNDKKHTLLS